MYNHEVQNKLNLTVNIDVIKSVHQTPLKLLEMSIQKSVLTDNKTKDKEIQTF